MADEQDNVVSSVITHAGKIATLEERQKTHEQDFTQAVEQVREDLYTAVEESIQGYTNLLNAALARIDALEEQVMGKAQKASAPAPAPTAKPDASTGKGAAPAPAPGDKPAVKVEEPAPVFRVIRRNGRLIKRAS